MELQLSQRLLFTMDRTTQYPRVYSLPVETLRALDAVATIPLALVITFSFLQLAGLLAKPISPIVLLGAGFIAGPSRTRHLQLESS